MPSRPNTLAFLVYTLISTTCHAQEIVNSYEYDANNNLIKITDGLGRVHNIEYDTLSRIKRIKQPSPYPGGIRPETEFRFDALDQLQAVIDPRKLITTYTVDGLGKRTRLQSPDSGQTNATYNELGYIKSSTDARGITTRFDYNLKNQITTITYGNVVYRLGYGEGQYRSHRLTSLTYPAGRTEFVWDQLGRLRSKKQTTALAGKTQTLEFAYTYGKSGYANGHLISMTYPSGNRLEYGYGLPGLITSITLIPANGSTPVSLLRDIQYRPFGPAQAWTWGNSTDTQKNTYAKTFDLADRITSFPLGNAFDNGVLRTLSYDAGNRIRSIIDTGILTPTQTTQTLDYDLLDRVTGYSDGTHHYEYQYDANGNRIQTTINGIVYPYAIDPASNRLKGINLNGNTVVLPSDKAGNQKSTLTSSTSFVYGPTGRIEGGFNSETMESANYYYNSLGERLNTANSHYLFNENGRMVGEYDLNGQAIEETVYLGEQPVAVLKPDAAQGTQIFYIYADHLHTPRRITRAMDDKTVWRWDVAEPFGASAPDENPSGLGRFVYNRRFPGQVSDAFLGLNYNYFRDYDPERGRYLQSDPIGLNGGLNTYSYVFANPVNNIDPFGLAVEGSFDRKTGIVTIKDIDTNQIIRTKAFSGNGQYANNPAYEGLPMHGPIPAGKYLIGDGYDSGHGGDDWWYKLYGPDGKGGYSYNCIPVVNPTTGKIGCRNGFNLHTGLASDGCITIPSDVDRNANDYPNSKDYTNLKQLLEKTKPMQYNGSTFKGIIHVR